MDSLPKRAAATIKLDESLNLQPISDGSKNPPSLQGEAGRVLWVYMVQGNHTWACGELQLKKSLLVWDMMQLLWSSEHF